MACIKNLRQSAYIRPSAGIWLVCISMSPFCGNVYDTMASRIWAWNRTRLVFHGLMMASDRFSILLCFLFFRLVFGYHYSIKTFTVPVDQFSFSSNETFAIRYLINDTYWNREKGPVFFYTGNEGDIEMFANNTGFMWEIAPKFKALIVFAEHRYYGKSLPFGNKSYTEPKYTGYLTSQQALADYVALITHLTWNETKAYRNPVIAFGGSYGGMLAAYLRMKYPHVVIGSLAASAPIWQFTGMTPCNAFASITTSDFTAESKSCSKTIRKSWTAINKITSTGEGLKWLSTEWKLCRSLQNLSEVNALKNWLSDVYNNLAMVNYPYPTNFLADLPAYPIREVCRHLQNATLPNNELLQKLFQGISIYFNYTKEAKCLDFGNSSTSALGDEGWYYQTCTEMVMPMCSNGITDMFEPLKWSQQKWTEECQKKWKATPDPFLAEKIYGGKNIKTASNIIFSNGLLDPWTGGGVLKAPNNSTRIFLIPEGAHHLDLRASNPADPGSVKKTRQMYQQIFKKWIEEHEQQYLNNEQTYQF